MILRITLQNLFEFTLHLRLLSTFSVFVASKVDVPLGGGLRKSAQSRSERNLLTAVDNDDKVGKPRQTLRVSMRSQCHSKLTFTVRTCLQRKSTDRSTPSYLKQTSSSSAKLSRAKSNQGLAVKVSQS